MTSKKQWLAPSIQVLSFGATRGSSKQNRTINCIENKDQSKTHDAAGPPYHAYFTASSVAESEVNEVGNVSFSFDTTRYGPS